MNDLAVLGGAIAIYIGLLLYYLKWPLLVSLIIGVYGKSQLQVLLLSFLAGLFGVILQLSFTVKLESFLWLITTAAIGGIVNLCLALPVFLIKSKYQRSRLIQKLKQEAANQKKTL